MIVPFVVRTWLPGDAVCLSSPPLPGWLSGLLRPVWWATGRNNNVGKSCRRRCRHPRHPEPPGDLPVAGPGLDQLRRGQPPPSGYLMAPAYPARQPSPEPV